VTKKHQETKREEVQVKSQMLQKSDCLVLDTGVSGFPIIDRVYVGFEI
jgi:hypothetical protein